MQFLGGEDGKIVSQIKPRLRSTPGLAEVNSSGGFEKQIFLESVVLVNET